MTSVGEVGMIVGDGARHLSRRFTRATIVLLFSVAAILFGGLFWATRGSDEISVERQSRIAKHSIDIALDSIALQQETVAVWDESAEAMFAAEKDQYWLRYNVTDWLHRMFGHNLGILLDAEETPVQVAVEGTPVDLAVYEKVRAELRPLIDSVHGRQKGEPGRHDRMPGQPTAPGSTVQTTARAVHDTHLMLVGGRPAVASAMLIKPSTDGYVGHRKKWPVLISVRYLDAGFMQELHSRYLLDAPRFSRVDNRTDGEMAQLLRSEWGDPLGYLIWRPEVPGSKILSKVLPANIFALLLLGALMLFLTWRLNQALFERGKLEEEAARLAYHDVLTGLPNRRLLMKCLQEALASSGSESATALFLIDIDRFKQVNDLLGHLAGDELIRQFAKRLQDDCRAGDFVSRLGGDEFALILSGIHGEDDAVERIQRTLPLFARPFKLFDQEINSGASIGGAISGDESIDAMELMRRADVALYRAKGDGRNCARLFHEQMDAAAHQRSQLANDMRRALAASEFTISSQPLVGREREIVGCELLLRWGHPTLGTISPETIIPIAEDSGLIVPIGAWVLHEALAVARANAPGFTAINLSPVQLRDEDFARQLVALCEREATDPRLIELEITEQTLLDDSISIRKSLKTLREAGFRIALDDFGTGYSSLGYLRRFSVDKIKIDRSFVVDAEAADTQAIIVAIVTLGRALGLTVAAEGVETVEQEAILMAAGVDQFQGHFYARPTPVDTTSASKMAKAGSLTRRVA